MEKTHKKILITGCSFSAETTQSGWKEENLHKTYSKMLERATGWQVDNQAIGGCSNREIFQRTISSCLQNQYEFVVVQWSELHRLWVYEAKDNVDDKTCILPYVNGINNHGDVPNLLKKIIVSCYLNDYMALQHWLHDQIALECFLKKNNLPYVFVRAFSNFVPELEHLVSQWSESTTLKLEYLDIPKPIKNMLNLDNNPDYYLHENLSRLILAYQEIDKSNCIGYNLSGTVYGLDPNFKQDYADDNVHPGQSVNQLIMKNILDHISYSSFLEE